MCLARSAHGVASNHPIFQGPRTVALTYEAAPTPDNYRKFWVGQNLPDSLEVWHVDRADYKTDQTLQPGTVSTGHGFLDSPDTEVIAGGINSKSHNAVALGRHGSLFLWGFASAPSGMTPSGQAAFVNSICYIQQFDHQPRLVERVSRDRGWALETAHFAKDEAKLASLTADVEYLVPDGDRAYKVDEDCKALGLSNRSIALLDECVRRLEADEDSERALRLLQRYTACTFTNAREWSAWLSAARSSLFFSDIGGYRWRECVDPDAEMRRALLAAPCATASSGQPIAASALISPPQARPGDIVTLGVRVRIAAGWHAYGRLPERSPYRPLRVTPELPEGWSLVGSSSLPESEPSSVEPSVEIYTGDAVFLMRVRVGAEAAAGASELDVNVSYMVCDEAACLPPDTLKVTAPLVVLE